MNSCDWTFENVVLPEALTYVWKWDESYNNLKASAYVKQAYATESWAISPVVNLGEASEPTVTFEHAEGYFDELNLSDVFTFYVREEGGEWSELKITAWSTKNWEWNTENYALDAYKGKKIQFGAKYTSTDAKAASWEIKNFRVSGSTAVAVIEAENAAPVYYDLNGRRVAEPANGLFIKVQGNKASKVIVK